MYQESKSSPLYPILCLCFHFPRNYSHILSSQHPQNRRRIAQAWSGFPFLVPAWGTLFDCFETNWCSRVIYFFRFGVVSLILLPPHKRTRPEWPIQKLEAPACMTLGIIRARKSPHSDKVDTCLNQHSVNNSEISLKPITTICDYKNPTITNMSFESSCLERQFTWNVPHVHCN